MMIILCSSIKSKESVEVVLLKPRQVYVKSRVVIVKQQEKHFVNVCLVEGKSVVGLSSASSI